MYDNYSHLSFKREGRVLTVTMSSPPMNAVEPEMHAELARVFLDISRDHETEVVVLTGEGRAFSAGANIKRLLATAGDTSTHAKTIKEGVSIIASLLDLPKPVIARINGDAVGVGATIALFCDISIASEKARIGDGHVVAGMSAGDGGAIIWPHLVGYAKAKHLLLTGDLISAPEAERIGLITRSVPPETLDEVVYSLAERLAASATTALSATKLALNMFLKEEIASKLERQLTVEMETMKSPDYAEALSALIERRKPNFNR
jgi:enoyl-CoA hydratase